MKRKTGVVLIALIMCTSAQGINMHALSFISHSADRLIAQNMAGHEHTTQNKTEGDTLNKMLDDLIKQGSAKMIALETADKMLKDIRSVSLNDLNDEQADKMMKVYRSVSEAYASNFRFKPAYLVFDEYIRIKNTYLERKMTQRLEKLDIQTKQLKDDNVLKISANDEQIKSLQDENESLSTAKQNVYRTIWIIVIIVAFCSGALIWTINHRYNKAKQLLNYNRSRMMDIAITSAIGEFSSDSNGNSYRGVIDQLKKDLSQLSGKLSSQSQAKGIASLLSRLKESISKL